MAFIPTEDHLKAPGGYIKESGKYTLRIDSVENAISSQGTSGYKLGLSCVESNQKMDERLWETEKAYWRICLFAKACSVQIAKGAELSIDKSFIGKTFEAEVRMTEPNANGKQFAEIAEFGPGKYDSLFSAAPVKQPAPAADDELEKAMW